MTATLPRRVTETPVVLKADDLCQSCGSVLVHTLEDPKGLRVCNQCDIG